MSFSLDPARNSVLCPSLPVSFPMACVSIEKVQSLESRHQFCFCNLFTGSRTKPCAMPLIYWSDSPKHLNQSGNQRSRLRAGITLHEYLDPCLSYSSSRRKIKTGVDSGRSCNIGKRNVLQTVLPLCSIAMIIDLIGNSSHCVSTLTFSRVLSHSEGFYRGPI